MNTYIQHVTVPALRSRRQRASLLAAGAFALGCALPHVLLAQSLPGIVVMNPGSGQQVPQAPSPFPGQFPQPFSPPPAMAPPQAAPAPPPAAAAKPKSRPVAKAAPKASSETASAEPASSGGGARGTGIAVLVNGEPITNYEIDQRAQLLGLQNADIGPRVQENMKRIIQSEGVNKRWKEIVDDVVKANQGKSKEQIIAIIQERQKAFTQGLQRQAVDSARSSVLPGLRQKAKQELIEEQVKNQEAKKAGVTPDESTIDAIVKDIAGRNKLTPQQFTQHFAQQGVDISTFKARFRAQQAWAESIKRKFGHMVNPNNRDIDKLMQQGSAGEDQVELQLHRIVVPVPSTIDQKSMAQRLVDAENLQQQFGGCKSTNTLAAKIDGARFENMGARKANNFAEPTRTLLLNARDEEMIPPSMTSAGIELLAVCGRKVVKATEEQRNQKAAELRQDEFERISKKHLRDVMADAVIENR